MDALAEVERYLKERNGEYKLKSEVNKKICLIM